MTDKAYTLKSCFVVINQGIATHIWSSSARYTLYVKLKSDISRQNLYELHVSVFFQLDFDWKHWIYWLCIDPTLIVMLYYDHIFVALVFFCNPTVPPYHF